MSELSKLRWRCRRGMKELDELLTRYLDEHYSQASPEEQRLFESLLEMQDPEIYAYMIGRDRPRDEAMNSLVQRIVTVLRT